MGTVGTFLVLHKATRSLTATQRMATYRNAVMASEVCFRVVRISDLLVAEDRANFVRTTAEGLMTRFDLPTQWSCFIAGWIIGLTQPAAPLLAAPSAEAPLPFPIGSPPPRRQHRLRWRPDGPSATSTAGCA